MRFPTFFSISSGLEKLLDRILCALGAVLFSQAPEFMQQYLQRLGGRLDEANRQLNEIRSVALRSGISLEEDSAHVNHKDILELLEHATQRVSFLSHAELVLKEASLLTRPFVFLTHIDWAIFQSTLSVYKPAVPTTLEGLVYALLGMGVFLALYYLTLRPLLVRIYMQWRMRNAPPII